MLEGRDRLLRDDRVAKSSEASSTKRFGKSSCVYPSGKPMRASTKRGSSTGPPRPRLRVVGGRGPAVIAQLARKASVSDDPLCIAVAVVVPRAAASESVVVGVGHSAIAVRLGQGRGRPSAAPWSLAWVSVASGVDHSRPATVERSRPALGLELDAGPAGPDSPPLRASGVGHELLRASVCSEGVPALGFQPLLPFCEDPYSTAVGVGQDEQPLAAVGGSHVGCS